jgi:putative intracellular protease/amidase
MRIAILLFDGVTALDAVGPYEVLSRLPGVQVVFVAPRAGVVRTPNGQLGLVADRALSDVPAADLLVLPGGFGTRALLADETLLGWIRQVHAGTQWTAAVCTGSLLLAAAGLLTGVEATTHWLEVPTLAALGAKPVNARVVEAGRIVTCAGVSAGIDLALSLAARLAGEEIAQAIQLSIEYDPAPPFGAGSPQTAPEAVVAAVRRAAAVRAT